MKISSLINNVYRSVSKMMRYFCEAEGAPQNSVLPCRLRGSSRADFVCFILCLALLMAFVPFSGTVQAQNVNYTLLINQENADVDTFLVRNDLTETRSAAAGTPLTDVLNAAELGSKFSGFHLTGTGAEITGYQPDDDITKPAGTYSEKGSPSFLFAHYESDGSMKADAMGALIDGRIVSGFFTGESFIPTESPAVRSDGTSIVLAFYSRDRYAISLRAHNDADPAAPVLSTGDAQISVLPEAPIIIKQGANLYERLVEDKGVGDILKYFSAHEPSYGDELQWTWWARWKGTKENGDPIYEIDPGNQFVAGRSRNKPIDPKHTGTVDLMEGPAYGLKDGDASVLEMWKRTVKLYGINYTYYEDGQYHDLFDENGMLNKNVKEEVIFGYHNDEAFYKEVWTNRNEGGYTVMPMETVNQATGKLEIVEAIETNQEGTLIYTEAKDANTTATLYPIGHFETNDNKPGSMIIRKTWKTVSTIKEPDSVTIKLHRYKDSEYLQEDTTGGYPREITINKNDGWKTTLNDVVTHQDRTYRRPYYFQIEEPSGNNRFKFSTSVTDYLSCNGNHSECPPSEINIYNTQSFNLKVEKTWDDEQDQDHKRPDELTVYLLRRVKNTGEFTRTGNSITLHADSDGKWIGTFSDLPAFNMTRTYDPSIDGYVINYEEYEYSVEEVVPEKYILQNLKVPAIYTRYVNASIQNYYKPETIDITVKKDWDDDNNNDQRRPQSIEIELLADGQSLVPPLTAELSASYNWTYTFQDLPHYNQGVPINYSVEEVVPESYTESYDPQSVTDTGTITVTNSHDPDMIKVAITKEWNDENNRDGKRPTDGVFVLLYGNNQIVGTAQVTEEPWTAVFEVQKNAGGSAIEYTAAELYLPNMTDYHQDGAPVEKPNPTPYDKHFTITNTYEPETVEVIVSKVWNDNNNQDNARQTTTVQLMKRLNTSDDPSPVAGETCTVPVTDGLVCTFSDLPKNELDAAGVSKEIIYSVEETGIPLYSKTEEEITPKNWVITNTYVPGSVSVPVHKYWDDQNDADQIRPDSVTFVLTRTNDNTQVRVQTLDIRNRVDDNHWSYTFQGLQENCGTVLCEYVVSEPHEPAGYTSTRSEDGLSITNTHTPERINITINKTWSDAGNVDGLRQGVTVHLMADGVEVQTATVGTGNTWSHTFTNLPKYQTGTIGGLIHYTVEEDTLAGYTTTISDSSDGSGNITFAVTNTHVPETVNVTVNKIWDDKNDQDGLRNKVEAKVQLFEQVGSGSESAVAGIDPVTVGTADNWSHTFENLPKYKTGQVGAEISYSIKETITVTDSSVTGTPYTGTVSGDMTDGFVVTNKHEPSKISVTITKEWDDNSNQDGIRRSGIAYYLEQNGTVVATYTSTNDDDFKSSGGALTNTWSHTFENLPEYCSGTKCTYVLTEPQNPRNYTQAYKVVGGVEDKLTIVNSHTPESVTVQGSKTWVDNDNRAGKRPGTIYIQLWKNGSLYTGSGARKTITKDTEEIEGTAWSWKWEGLPKYENGQEIKWSVLEENVSDYQASYPSAYNVTNTYNEGTKSISVKKVWNDDENRDGIRPTYIYVDLYADGVKTTQSKALADANSWLNTFTDLPIYKEGATGVEIVYTVKEANAVSGYSISEPVFDSTTNTFTITNTHTPATTTVQGSKTWVQRELDTNPPSQILIHLYADGTLVDGKDKTITVDSKELDGTTPWSWKWEGLPKYKEGEVGKEIVYTVRETPLTGYNTTLNSPNVTNTYSPGKTSLSVRKAWVDGNNQDGIRPGHVEVALLSKVGTADFSPTGQTAILVPDSTTPNLWRVHTFDNLDRFTSTGQPITYSVKEIGTIPGYTSSEPILDQNSGVYVITNTHTPDTITITGEKVWDNDDDPTKPTSVTVHLLANGVALSDKTITVTETTAQVDGKAWTWKWEGLPKYANGQEITYTVSEDTLDDYTLTVQRTPAADGKSISFVLTNTYDPGMITVRVQKVWEDNNNQDGIRPTSVEVKLIADGKTENPVATATLPQEGTWRARFNVPEYDGTRKIVYTVAETFTDVLTESTDGPGTYMQEAITGDVENGFVITNVHTPETVYIHGNKAWEGDENAPAGTRPESVTFVLKRNNETIAYTVAHAADNWEWEFPLQPRYVNGVDMSSAYEVTELNVPNYETEIDGWIDTNEQDYTNGVTNIYTPGKTSVSVTKVWRDNDNQDGIRPARVAVQLVADGIPVPERYLVLQGTGNSWIGTFNDLDIYPYGSTTPIVYTVQEVGTYAGYTMQKTGDMATGFTITNSHRPETTEVSGTKTWDDNNNQDGKRPTSIKINLLKNGAAYESKTITAEDSWAWSWTGLPKYENGSLINWTITEDSITDYTQAVSGYNVTNSYTPGKTSIRVNKVWSDGDNQDGLRPANIVVFLKANGETIDTAVLNQSNSWSYQFRNLDRNKDGQPIVYTVEELHTEIITGTDGAGTYKDTVTETAAGVFTVTNTHTPETVTVSGSKEWANVPAGVSLPESITIHLYANNAELTDKVKTVTAVDGWNWSWEGLPKYSNGREISYTVSEDQLEGYTRVVEKTGNSFKVTNTYNPGNVTIVVRKEWKDNNNQDGIRPPWVLVNLLGDGKVVDSAVLGSSNEWRHRFTVPEYDGTRKITYTTEEVYDQVVTAGTDGPGTYAMTGITKTPSGFIIENTHTPEKVSVEGSKTWDDNDNQDGKRPTSITIRLYKNNTEYDHKVVTADANGAWSWSWTNLPKYENGSLITWSIREDDITDYSKSVNGFDVTNSYTPGKTVVTVSKVWSDNNNQDGIQPAYVEVMLYADGVSTGKTGVLLASNGWTYRFTDLDINKDGKKIVYTVVEENVPAGYTVSYSGDAATGLTVTNTHEPEKVKIVVTKTWDDAGNETNRPGEVNLYLHADGEQIQYKQFTSAETAAAGWKWEIDNLPKYKNGGTEISYTIRENTYEEYTRSVSRSVTPATGTEKEQLNLAVTNKWTPGTTSIAVQKIWTDASNQDGIRPTWVLINLKDEAGNVVASERVTAPTWLVRFENIDEYDASGKLIKYSVEEVFDRTVTEKTDGPGTYKLVEIKSVDDGFTIENAHTPEKVTVSGVKTWDDNNNQDGKRPTSIKINLLKNGSAYESKTVTEADGWAWSWTGLPKYENGSLINWTITEDSITDYTQSLSGYNVTNKYTPGKTSIRVNKVWSDGDNQDGLRPANIVVFLKANGETIDTAVLNQSNSWSYQFRNLDRNKDGQPIVYTVEELHTEIITGTDGAGTYKDVVAGTAEGVFTITNTHTPETVRVSGSKEWANVPAGVSLPESITIHLYANNAELTDKVKTITAADGWNWSWEGLPKYSNGREISYTVSEDQVEGYTRVVEKTGNSFKVTNTYNPGNVTIVVRKEWKDNNNQDGIRPPWVLVNLLGDGKVVDSAVLGSSNEWRHRFTVPEYDGTRKITYTTEEVYDQVVTAGTDGPGTYAMTGITKTPSGFIIENTHTPEKVSVEGSKTWDDNDNQDGKRPTSITIRLFKNNTEYDHKVVTAGANAAWSWSFVNLPKYENGSLNNWSIREDDITDYSKRISGYDVTNSYTPGKTVVTVTKVWSDSNNQDGIRPAYAVITLYADGVSTGKTCVLLESNGWTYQFTDLDSNKDGKKIVYTAVEENVPAGYIVSYSGDAATGLTVTNTHEPEKVKIVVTKTWDDAGNETNRPGEVNLYLHADGEQIQYKQFTSAETAAAGWKWEIDNLPKYKNGGTEITYTIRENTYEEYSRSVSRSVTPATGTEKEQLNLAVTNKWTPGKTSIAVQKIWTDGNNQDGIRPTWVLINLKDEAGNVVASERVTAPTWLVRFENIDEYDASGKPIKYSVEEVFDRTVTEKTDGPGTYKLVEIKSVDDGFTIENAHTPEKVTVSGVKTWDDNNNQDGKRPTAITINLMKNNVKFDSKIVSASSDWKWSWTGLDKYENGQLINWSISEEDITDYSKVVSGYNVTNSYTPGKTAIRVNKVWDDNENQDGLRPANIVVYLKANGETVATGVLNQSSGWSYLFSNLDRNKDGKPITYTVEELHTDIITGVDGPGTYQDLVSGNPTVGFTVTNVHTPETVKVVVTKTWDDAGNESKRPTEVNLYLDADGEQIRYQQFTSAETAAAGWKWEIDNLPKYKNGGTEISYTIRENTYPDYSRSVSHSVTPATDTEKELLNIAVTNKWTPGKTTIAVQKKWTDANDQDGIRPTWVLVNLLDGSKNVVASGRVTKENNWILRFENIDQYDASGNPIQYSVEEVYDRTITEDTDGPGTYKLAGIKTIEGGFEIENEHTPETVTVSGTKTWNDNDNQDGKRPTSITIRLLKNNVEYDSKTVTAADGWKWEWTKLPKYENGKQITWSINENDVIDYTKVVSGYNVTNTYDPGKINIRVNKVWTDENDQDGLRQLNVTVFLKANGETVATGVLNEASGWSYVFTNQDRNKDGKAITYTVEELHTAFITGTDGPGTYQDVVTGDATKGFTITNTHTPETVTLKGTKTWVGTELDPEAPTELKVHLYANGTEVTAQAKTVTAADDWKWQWTNLPKYANGKEITYTMSEDTDYTKRVVREGDTFNVTNTYNPDEITILIRKVWNDNNNQDGIRPPWTLVNLKGNGETVASEFLNDGNEWRVRIDVPQYDENQQEIEYTVEEVFTRTVTKDTDGPGTYKLESISGNAKDGFTIINKHTPETVDVAGSKTWNDNDNAAGMRPSAIKIQLNKNGVAYGAAKNVTEADGWTWEWKKVPKYENGQLISWSINEENVEGYSKTVTGYNVTNTYTPDETVVTVRKAWNDKDNQDGLRTDHSRVYLLADGERTGDEGILIAANEWVYRFRRLPVMKDGKKIVYTVEEDPVPAGYTASYSGDQDKGLVVTNTHDPETVKIVVTKTWDDAGNEANRPENVNLYLQADGATIRNGQFTSDETAAVGWKWEIDNLPKFKNGGTAIAYTIVENDSGEYSRSVERSVTPKTDTEKEQLNLHVINKWTPGTTSIVVEKEWTDNGNQDGIRPPWILVNLLDGDGNVVQSGRLTAENNWLLRFDGVEEFDESGQKIAYSVEEVYDNVITKETDGPGTYRLIAVREIAGGFEIENGHTPETVTVSGAKTWNDEGNESARPESITIRVLGDGAEAASKEITAADDWKWEFSGLPKYKAGKLITYTITEDAIPNYTPQINGFNVTNTYEEGVTSVSVKKIWSDGSNQDGLRDWVVIKLLANGEETEHMTVLSDSNHWEHTFTRLPAMAGGEAIVYTVDEEKNSRITGEDGPGTYKIDIQGDQTAGFIVNNIHTPETVTISGHKTWDDNENENQARPQSIFIQLHGDGQLLHRVEVTEADDWAWNFVDLPKYANGKEIKYSIREEAVENYTPSYSGYDVTNTYTQGKTSVSVSKIWDDGENRDNLRPTWILVKLLENGEESGMMAVLNERNSWKHTFTNLDVSKDGQPISYTVAEELGGVLSDTDTAETYGFTTTGSAAEGYVITNKHTPVTTSVSVTKDWDDGEDRDGKRPAEVLIRLYANRVQIDQDYIRPDEEGKWTLSFTNLPKNENGKPISYTVEEMPIEDYSTTISGDASTGYTITNSYTPGETSLTVTKRWEDDSNRDGKRPASAVIHLLADGEEVDSITLAANNNWQHTFTGLPVNKDGVKIVYTVTEDTVEGYSAPVVEGDADNGFTVVNAYHPQTIDIPVTKVWDDGEDQDSKRPESVTVRLLADGAEVANTTLPLEGVWTYTFTGRPVYQNGKEISYTLTEDSVDDYTTSITGAASVGFTVTNSYEPGKTSLSVAKRWEDADNQDGIRPEEVTVTLLANGQPTDQVVKLNAENNWRHEFESLDEYDDGVKIAYSVSEEAVDGYTTTIEGDAATGYTIVNAHTPENIAVRGVKVWNDNDNAAGVRPDHIIVRLHANEVEIDSQSVYADAEGNWEWAFRGLPKYADEREIRYTVTEDAPEQYSAEITGNAKDGFTITNTYAENKTSLFVSKHWTDFYDNDGKRPKSVEVKVLADYGDGNGYVPTDYSGVITGPDWELIINDLPLTVDGKRVKYTVSEETAPGYTAVVEGDQTVGYMITNVHELETITVSGQKTWNDNNNSAQARPEAIVVRLNSDGTLLHEIRVTAEDDWKWSFSGLPKYLNGREIVYTIHENPVDNYTPEISADGFSITNNYTSGKRSLPVDVAWLDQNDKDGIRPGSVTIKLFADGEDTGKTLILDESNGWRGRFTDLAICSSTPKGFVSKAPSYEDICAAEGTKHVVYTVQEVHTDVITGENTEKTYSDEYVGSSHEGWTVINRHTPVTISVDGSKTWAGNGPRPESVTIRLLEENVEIARKVVTEADNWSWSFSNLPKYKNGTEVIYSIAEDTIEEYTAEVNGYDVTNRYTPTRRSLMIRKVWDDNDNAAGIRPENVTVRILSNDTQLSTVVLNENNLWYAKIDNLPIADASGEILYTVEETEVPTGYTARIAGDMNQGYQIINTYTPDLISFEVRKVWSGVGEKPSSVTVELLVNGAKSGQTLVLSAEHGWVGSFTDLPADAVYGIEELDVPAGYVCTVSGSAQTGFTVTNTIQTPPEPPEPPHFFRLTGELPETGITSAHGFSRADMPASVNYLPTSMELQLPTLNVMSSIVTIEAIDGRYPVEWLGFDAGLLDGTAKPGEGISVLAAHNTLNREDYGPFALIMTMEEGDRFFVTAEDGSLMIFQVYANEKIGSHDYDALWNVASEFDNTLTLLTCEDERAEGGYSSRRVVSARRIGSY